MLHQGQAPSAAIAEAKRILRPRGRLVLMVFTREDLAATWMTDYWPSTRAWMDESHPALEELLRLVPGARVIPVVWRDLEDGSLAALGAFPEKRPAPA